MKEAGFVATEGDIESVLTQAEAAREAARPGSTESGGGGGGRKAIKRLADSEDFFIVVKDFGLT